MNAWRYTLEAAATMMGASAPSETATFSGVSTDTRTLKAGQVFFALQGANFDGNGFVRQAFDKGAAAAVTNTASGAGSCIVVPDTLAALQRFAARHRERYKNPLFALTGSCGKTTAKDFTAALVETKFRTVKTQGNLNNEIGTPLSLLNLDDETKFAVIEMGANHAGEIARLCTLARPTESAVTMVAAAHLEGFGSIERVAAAKAEIVDALGGQGCFYVNADDAYCRAMAERHPGEKIYFGSLGESRGNRLDVVLEGAQFDEQGQMVLRIDPIGTLRLPLSVRAHATNVLLAVAVALRHGVDAFEAPLREACAQATRFRVLRVGPLEILDDTYNANPASMAAALDALTSRPGGEKRIAALGEMLELGKAAAALHAELGERAAELGVTHLFARGPNARGMIAAARANGVPHAEAVEDHSQMAEAIQRIAAPGDVLLLKGSRGMRMERVLDHLRAHYANSDPGVESSMK